MKTKRCTKCKVQKTNAAFYKDKRDKSGFACWCKQCRKEWHQSAKGKRASKKFCQIHREQKNEYSKKYRKTLVGCLRSRFRTIKQRCNNPNCLNYKYYGGRGIKCLFESSQEFVDYVINKLKADPRGLEIDRIDNNGHYEPDNIRFVTAKVNANNRGRKK